MPLPQIIALLHETLGLDVASVGISLIERAVKRRVNVNDPRDISQYADLLQRSQPELQNLFEAVAETVKHEKERVPNLAFAEQLADKGQLGEAAEICEVFLREEGPSARAFHLLGLIRDCAGDQHQAGEFYRKALYLEPDRYEVLIHLALLKDKSGDSVGAKTLKNRARRVLERTK